MKYLLLYLMLINLVAFATMGIDKAKAKRRVWRTPEATLLLLAVIGGSVGAIAGMLLFRHKTRHAAFRVGLPVILVIHVIITCFFVFLDNNL